MLVLKIKPTSPGSNDVQTVAEKSFIPLGWRINRSDVVAYRIIGQQRSTITITRITRTNTLEYLFLSDLDWFN
jgi:hypothetical protein